MDPLTHLLATCALVGRRPSVVAAGLAPDVPFFATYPVWLATQGRLRHALATHDWPDPPRCLATLHRATHSIPVALAAGAMVRLGTGRWYAREVLSWTLHILIDIPTHRRDPWGPRALWPLSNVAFDGVQWVDGVAWVQRGR